MVLFLGKGLQPDFLSVGQNHQGGACMLSHFGICALFCGVVDGLCVCDVTLFKLGTSRPSHLMMTHLQIGGDCDTSDAELLKAVHLAEHGSFTTERNRVTANVGVMLVGMSHAFQLPEDLVMYLL